MLHLKKLALNQSCLLLLYGVLLLLANDCRAQVPLINDTTKNVEQSPAPIWPADSLGRRTPRGTLEGFIKAVAAENYTRAALYLRQDTALQENPDRVKLAQALQGLLENKGNIYPYSWISDEPKGLHDDNLGPNLDRVGVASVNGESFDLILENTEGPEGAPVWLFSSETLGRVPLSVAPAEEATLVEKVSPSILEEKEWRGVPIAHWLAIMMLILVAYLLAWGLTKFLLFLIPLLSKKARMEHMAGIIKAFELPIRLYVAVWLFIVGSREAGISIIVRQRFSDVTLIVGLIALLLLLWQLLNFTTRFVEKRMARRGNHAGVSAILFLRRTSQVALIILGIIIILDTVGFDVTTWLAALGIGGIALALGAQKTVENFVGSVTLITDQPIRVGDFCKAGDILGTVEQIGMRTTRIRTLNRTIVSIPNGEFSSMKIENFAHRDRFWFHPIFNLRFETTPDQIRFLLVELRAILYAHPKVDPDSARIRFIEIGRDSLRLEVFSYINAVDYDRFLEIQEDLFLRMMDVVSGSGSGFAYPSQTVYFAGDQGVSEEKTAKAEDTVQKWREAGEMHIPAFTPESIHDLRNTIPYPPAGSSAGRNKQHN